MTQAHGPGPDHACTSAHCRCERILSQPVTTSSSHAGTVTGLITAGCENLANYKTSYVYVENLCQAHYVSAAQAITDRQTAQPDHSPLDMQMHKYQHITNTIFGSFPAPTLVPLWSHRKPSCFSVLCGAYS